MLTISNVSVYTQAISKTCGEEARRPRGAIRCLPAGATASAAAIRTGRRGTGHRAGRLGERGRRRRGQGNVHKLNILFVKYAHCIRSITSRGRNLLRRAAGPPAQAPPAAAPRTSPTLRQTKPPILPSTWPKPQLRRRRYYIK